MYKHSIILILGFISFFQNEPDEKNLFHPICLEIKKSNSGEIIKLTKGEEKELKSFYKDKKLEIITKNEVQNHLEKAFAEIFLIYKEPNEDIESKNAKVREKMVSIPEIARMTTLSLFYISSDKPDSIGVQINSFPFSKYKNTMFQKTINTNQETTLTNSIKATLDSCILNNFFDK